VAKIISQRTVESAKPPKDGRAAKADGIVPGMQFIVHAGGKKSFRLIARVHGKQVNLEIGDASLMTLSDARIKARGILGAIANGEDPRETKQEAARVASETVAVVARRFVLRHAQAHNKTWKEVQRKLDVNVLPHWGRRPIASITRRDVVALLDEIVDRGAVVEVNRVLATIRKLFSWAVERDLIEVSPCAGVKPPTPERARDRVLTDAELALVWRVADRIGYPFGAFTRLLVLTGQRRAEVAGMRWSELDADRSLWTIPAERVKNGVEHTVPLSPWAKGIIAGLPRIAGSDFCFSTTGVTSISGYSRAKRSIDAGIAELNDGTPIPPWILHDIRRSVASGMARLGVSLPTIEKVLNHTSGSFAGIVGVYQRHNFADEKRNALERWGMHVADLVSGHQSLNVVRLGTRA
jgi:integrase